MTISHHFQARWLLIFLFVLTGFQGAWGYHHHPNTELGDRVQDEKIIETAKAELPHQGTVEQGPDGFVYLKVTDEYAYRLFPLLKEDRGFTVPSAIKRHSKPGAHISIFYANEANSIGPIRDIGKEYSFEPKAIKRVRSGAKEYIILEVQAPELEKLRESYGFSPKLKNHEFHITLAEKRMH